MLKHLIAILGLALLCGAWVGFQRWLKRVDPDGRHIESGCGGCGGHCKTSAPAHGRQRPQ
ncbi:hypothetical protein [Thiocystis violacea]|uniref:hypothetical protein n=1 Tax=Thiocystis violacea TaxID=13725 RepID=UPI001906216D|nr:hypothetical protein [Thiocystis violacea]MBK1723971.1 hypothetical protein [Thiocystis violacea]